MSTARPLRALLVDPSLFTAPYDAALTQGLLHAGVEPTWAVRPTRNADRSELDEKYVDAFFYRWIERQDWLPGQLRSAGKGLAHALGLAKLVWRVARQRPDVVHFQWAVVPPLDSLAMLAIRCLAPVVLTVHDTVPFNGERISVLQNLAFDAPIRLSHRVIVHTQAGRDRLEARGIEPAKLTVIPHGPLSLQAEPTPSLQPAADDRYCFVLFGELKPYKGLDVLVEALASLPADVRARCRCVIAGRPRMDLSALEARIRELELQGTVELRRGRLSEQEMADLFASADSVVFPYRQIDASGVYFLVKSLGKWLIASNVGVFAEDLQQGVQGQLVPPGDAGALAVALAQAVRLRPCVAPIAAGAAWASIGEQTHALYASALSQFTGQVAARAAAPTAEAAP